MTYKKTNQLHTTTFGLKTFLAVYYPNEVDIIVGNSFVIAVCTILYHKSVGDVF